MLRRCRLIISILLSLFTHAAPFPPVGETVRARLANMAGITGKGVHVAIIDSGDEP